MIKKNKERNFTILGAGTWGIALSKVLISNGHKVSVWHYKKEYIDILSKKREHEGLACKIPKGIKFISNDNDIELNSCIIICLPSQKTRAVLTKLNLNNTHYISASKGIELETGKLISDIIRETTPGDEQTIACLSGPSHAEEVVAQIPTVVSCASKNIVFAEWVQTQFSNSFFRAYSSECIEAVQVGGAVKNIISIASGICSGLNYGDNTIAALISRGIQEIIRFSKIYSFKTQSLLGISGIGDLIVTSTSEHSRNKLLGRAVGQGQKLENILKDSKMIVEGVETSKAVYFISKKHNISMPICNEVYKVLFNRKSPSEAINDLMSRELKPE